MTAIILTGYALAIAFGAMGVCSLAASFRMLNAA